MTTTVSGVEWIVALIAPWTISSHPNFSQPSTNVASHLALVTEGRSTSEKLLQQVSPSDDQAEPSWAVKVASIAAASLDARTQNEATAQLIELAESSSASYGAKCAAGIFATVALADQDRPLEAIALLRQLLEAHEEISETTSSTRLIAATVAQQASLRAYEVANREDAHEYARLAKTLTSSVTTKGLESFPVSPGISWRSTRVQLDVREAISAATTAALATLDDRRFSPWHKVVRSRSGWVATRAQQRDRIRDGLVLRDTFESRFETFSGRRHFGRDNALNAGYVASLQAELSGDYARTRASREALGKIIMLEAGTEHHFAVEALRVLRRARAEKTLQSVLGRLRNDGPTSALREEAARVVHTAEIPATRESLMVLEYAGEFLDQSLLSDAIDFSFEYTTQPGSAFKVSWSLEEVTWKTVSRLVEGSGRDADVASRALRRLESDQSMPQPLANRLAETLNALDWTRVARDTRSRYKQWSRIHDGSDSGSILRALQDAVPEIERRQPEGLEAVIDAINGEPSKPSGQDLHNYEDYLVEAVELELKQASTGYYAFGGVPVVDVAVAFASRFSSSRAWLVASRALTSGVLHPFQKNAALDRLASSAKSAPIAVRDAFKDKAFALIERDGASMLSDDSELSIDGALVRASAALGAIEAHEALLYAVRLAAESPAGKLEAAKTLQYCADADATAAHVLLLQLSYEPYADVRAEAGYALVLTSNETSDVSPLVADRAEVMLLSDGVRVPLRALHALQNLQQAGRPVPARFRAAASAVRERSASARVVRAAADRVLSGEFER